MEFVSDPPISVKIRKMEERIHWGDSVIVDRGIDQTRLVIADKDVDNPEFSFLVIGDSGSGSHRGHNPQRQIAEQMLPHLDSCKFIIHTGDVIYLVGSSEYYQENFIKPYREFLVGGEKPERIAFDQMLFKLPFLPVPGNHDYYDLPFIFGFLAQTTRPLRRLIKLPFDFDVGWHGSAQGDAYARAFIDYLKRFNNHEELKSHLESHYTAQIDSSRCLVYQPGKFTKLPNRYYTFRYGGIDFFALDSNTFNAPPPLPATAEGQAYRRQLETRLAEIEYEEQQVNETAANLNPDVPEEAEHLDDLRTKLQQLDELKIDIQKQLSSNESVITDVEQLDWLQQRLIASWLTDDVRGRVIYFHHPPYVTEATKWYQAQTLAIRDRLRQVLDNVSEAVGSKAHGRPLVDLIFNGHAHCLEYLRTHDTGHADSNMNWIVCGGSGYSLRRQRKEGPELMAKVREINGGNGRLVAPLPQESTQGNVCVARSLLYVGRTGQGSQKRRPYSFLRVDVKAGLQPKFVITPYISERFQRQWHNTRLEPFTI